MNTAEKLAAALRGLPDECGMIEHNPDEGPRLFCCGGDVVETLRSTTRKHAPGCWYVQAREALAEYDAQRAKENKMSGFEYLPENRAP